MSLRIQTLLFNHGQKILNKNAQIYLKFLKYPNTNEIKFCKGITLPYNNIKQTVLPPFSFLWAKVSPCLFCPVKVKPLRGFVGKISTFASLM